MLNSDISYLFGSYFGDGHVDYKRHAYQFIMTSEDNDFLVYNSQIVNNTFGKPGSITPVNNHFKLVVCSKDLCTFILDHFCSIPDYSEADRYHRKGKLPDMSSLDVKSFFQGLMDADGWISRRKNGKYWKYEIGFKNSSVLTPEIYRNMKDYGLSCTKLSKIRGKTRTKIGKTYKRSKDSWEWYITPYDYISKIGFRILRKQKLANRYLIDRGHI